MDLLETVLRSANAEKYIDVFTKYKIEAGTLPLLSDSDLRIIGVEEKALREAIVEKASNLRIPREELVKVSLTKDDVELILNQIAYQLNLHHAALSCGVIRKDVVVCDVKLKPMTKCLLHCVDSLEERLNDFERGVGFKRKSNRKVIIAVAATGVFLLIFGKFCKF